MSRKLITGADKTDDRGWRLPAEETELAVIAASRQMLSDRGALASTLKACGLAAAELKQALEVVDRKVGSSDEIGSTDAAGSIVERVELKRDGMQIRLNFRALECTSGNFQTLTGKGGPPRSRTVLRSREPDVG